MDPLKQTMAMKKNRILWGVLPMMAAILSMVACNRLELGGPKTIPYMVKVDAGDPATRATVDDDYQTLYFAEGDKLYISGTDIQGVLDIQTGVGTAGATFSGNLSYSGEGSPADDLTLTATLVSAEQMVGKLVSVNSKGAVTVNYPRKDFCKSVYEAVKQYSRLTGTSTYGATSFTLNQMTAFLNFEVTYLDGTPAGANPSPEVLIDNRITYTGAVTTTTVNGKVVAQFVLPVAAGTTINFLRLNISGATFFTDVYQPFTGRVYNVRKKKIAPSLNLTNPAVGQVICRNGNNYDSPPHNMKAFAKICYVNVKSGHGLALAVTDEEGYQNWYTAQSTAAAYPLVFSSGGTWKLPSKDEWDLMINAAGGFTKLCKGFESVGGTNMQDNLLYWSSTQINGTIANSIASWGWTEQPKNSRALVRACLVF